VPAKNVHRDAVVAALRADGWTVTHDPLTLKFGDRTLFADLGAERAAIAAERAGQRIAVEIQSFLDESLIHALHSALGQYVLYRAILQRLDPERALYLAVSEVVAASILAEPVGQLVISEVPLRVLVFDEQQQRITRWIG
jgi:XisH protein